MIRAVIFDYFGVISSDEYWNLVKADKSVSSDFLNIANRVNLGKLHWRDFIRTVADRTGQQFEQVERMYAKERINPAVLALAQELHATYKTGIITNAHHEFLEPIVAQAGLEGIFDSIIISSRVGYIKPDRRIFDIALSELSVEPAETVFIDDIERNADAAANLGFKTIHYRSIDQLRRELVAYLRR